MRNELIPKVLKEYRKQNNYSVNDVALLLHERSFDVAAKTIYGWESVCKKKNHRNDRPSVKF